MIAPALLEKRIKAELASLQRLNKSCFNCGGLVRSQYRLTFTPAQDWATHAREIVTRSHICVVGSAWHVLSPLAVPVGGCQTNTCRFPRRPEMTGRTGTHSTPGRRCKAHS